MPNSDKGLGFVARYGRRLGGSDATDRMLKDSAGKPSKRY